MAIIWSFLSNLGFGHGVILVTIAVVTYSWLTRRPQQQPPPTPPLPSASSVTETKEYVSQILPDDLEHVPFKFEAWPESEMIEKSRQFFEWMNERRSVRFYSSKKIPQEVIENIVAAAGTSPSGAHTEPWTYVVVSGLLLLYLFHPVTTNSYWAS